ncbi:MAG TPA: LemA family protein [Albitalea sp.]|uniref:LemA family protein n=1 Tax=Piscinibacter sp. TaxID=1903157 RepID=UPI002ED25976
MTSTHIAGWAIAAVLLFWAVGAYNRLVSLRNGISRAFVPVDAQIRQRHLLLEQWVDALRPLLAHDPQASESVLAACSQLQAACDVVRSRPSAARPMASLRLAEETLAEARNRLRAHLPAKPEMLAGVGVTVLGEELTAADNTLNFARRQFNEATQSYNDALDQFPTWVIAGLFGFRRAGTL